MKKKRTRGVKNDLSERGKKKIINCTTQTKKLKKKNKKK